MQKWGPHRHMEGLRKREGTHGKKGITQEKVSLGIVRGRGYKIDRSPLILIIQLCAFGASHFNF